MPEESVVCSNGCDEEALERNVCKGRTSADGVIGIYYNCRKCGWDVAHIEWPYDHWVTFKKCSPDRESEE